VTCASADWCIVGWPTFSPAGVTWKYCAPRRGGRWNRFALESSASSSPNVVFIAPLAPPCGRSPSLMSRLAQSTKNLKKKDFARLRRNSGMPPGTSSAIGRSRANAASPSSIAAYVHGLPIIAFAVSGHATVLNDMPPNPSARSVTTGVPPSRTSNFARMPAVTMAMSSSLRCDCLNSRTYSPGAVRGRVTDRNTSSGLMSHVLYPLKNVAAGTALAPRSRLSTVNVAPHAIQSGFRSLIGLAVHTFPPMLETLRTCGPANQRSCSLIAVSGDAAALGRVFSRSAQKRSSRVSVVDAPNVTDRPSLASTMLVSSGTCVGATTTEYLAHLNLVSTPTSVFPHTSFASGCAFFSASKPASVAGRCHVVFAPGRVSALASLRLSSGGKMGSLTAVTESGSAAPRAFPAGVCPPADPHPLTQGSPVDGQIGPLSSFPGRSPEAASSQPFACAWPFARAWPFCAWPFWWLVAATAPSIPPVGPRRPIVSLEYAESWRVARERGEAPEDGAVPRAPTQVTAERLLDLVLRGLGLARAQERVHAHDEAGGAESALRAVRARRGRAARGAIPNASRRGPRR
jgi:hypothetical protein